MECFLPSFMVSGVRTEAPTKYYCTSSAEGHETETVLTLEVKQGLGFRA